MKKSKWLVAGLVALMMVWQAPKAANSSPGGSTEFPSSDRGMKVFQAYCVGCHGLSGKGDGPMSAALFRDFGVRPTDLTRKYLVNKTDEHLKSAVKGGGTKVHKTPYMPAWGQTLTDGQVDDLLAYVREMQSGNVKEQPAFVELGEQLEFGRVLYSIHCVACHGAKGQGDGPFIEGLKTGEGALTGFQPPDLTAHRFFRDKTDADMEDLISKTPHHSGLQPRGESNWWQRQLNATEMEALILYLRTLPLGRNELRS